MRDAGSCSEEGCSPKELPSETLEGGHGRPSILVVDDVASIVRELVIMLNLQSLPATGAHSLDEALDLLLEHPSLRVVACDVRLNGESGADLVVGVKSNPVLAARDIRFVFMTGDAMRYDSSTPIHGYQVLMKPVLPGVLVAALSALINEGRAE